MWVFLTEGFFSIVAHKYKPEHFLIRCRNRKHMEAVFPDAQMYELPDADYRYRADIPKEIVLKLMGEQITNINEPNFKNTIMELDYYNAAVLVWRVMYDYGLIQD